MKASAIIRLPFLIVLLCIVTPLHAECKRINGVVVCTKPGTTPGGGDLMTVPELKKQLESFKPIEEQIRDLEVQIQALEALNG